MATTLQAGKLRRLEKLADPTGRFRMMAIDQRGSLIGMLAKTLKIDPKAVPYDAVSKTKETLTRSLSPLSTGLLTDPIYGYPYSATGIPGSVGLLLAYEDTGYEKSGPSGNERRSKSIEGWSIEKAARSGADAIKFLLYTQPDATPETQDHQQDLMRRVGRECREAGLPFLLELVVYPLDGGSADTPEFARAKPDLVARSAAEFSKPEYDVDILKLEFPCNLKYTDAYCRGFFDGRERDAVYSLEEVASHCRRLDASSTVPWVILSAGVDIDEFLVNVQMASEAGASGFLCGRAIWKDAVGLYPDLEAMEQYCRTEAAYNSVRCNAFADKALPWYDHRKFGGRGNVRIEGLSPEWYRN